MLLLNRMTRHRATRLAALTCLATCALALLWSDGAHAELVLQAENPTYAVSTDGVMRTDVKLYLSQTGGTTILTDEGGINQFQITLSASSSATPPTLVSLTTNPAFTGNKVQMPATGELGGSFFDFVSGVPAIDGKIFLGTAQFTGTAATASTLYTLSAPASAGYNYTAAGTDLAGQIGSGQFTIVVPEPTCMGVVTVAVMGLAVTRRRRFASGPVAKS
jgi:hypothetical protein